MSEELITFYEEVGGEPVFAKLAHEFYKGVAKDPVLKAMYPEEDLGPAEERLKLFLEQYWGGPSTYSDTRGHPRLRATCPSRSILMPGSLVGTHGACSDTKLPVTARRCSITLSAAADATRSRISYLLAT
jgi:hypothetical protein